MARYTDLQMAGVFKDVIFFQGRLKLKEKYKDDLSIVRSKRHSNGGDLWATEDNNIGKGSPFSTKDVALMLLELGFTKRDAIIKELAELIFEMQQKDGRFKIAKASAIYPCHTIGSLRTLCYLGYSKDKRLKGTFEHLLNTQQNDGGWQCNKFSLAAGLKQNIPIRGQPWKHWTRFGSPTQANQNNNSIRLLNFCYGTGK
jgi:hypothetical protein